MARKHKPSDIYVLRQKNYLFFFDEHKRFMALPPELKEEFRQISLLIGKPEITITGCCEDGTWKRVAMVASAHRLAVALWDMIHPFASEEGWLIYRSMFEQLPEIVDVVAGIPISVPNWPNVKR